jgi:hypothetical protein
MALIAGKKSFTSVAFPGKTWQATGLRKSRWYRRTAPKDRRTDPADADA